ncbi:MAG: phosphoribosylamine--glycine ligase [Bacteroidota bacterium]|nr:MAG: phosphoribosylamine--glycine ligase [Bacteroidota bacterium]
MNILLIGSGGREHALAWKMAQSPRLNKLYIAPGNAGTSEIGTNVALETNQFEAIGQFVLSNQVDLVIVGPEDPLVKGIRNYFEESPSLKFIPVIGPSAEGARLEGSKEFAKEFMVRHRIPTAGYLSVTKQNIEKGLAFLDKLQPPFVLKADGLAAGKGVLILSDRDEAKRELTAMLGGMFGMASEKVVIEEFLDGIEMSAFAITDGISYKILPEAKDYKRIGEGDTGLNTGGMGCVSPVPFAGEEFMKKVEDRVIRPTIEGLKRDGIAYNGFLFFGLMNIKGEPFVIEYNVRMGDPETEVIMPRLKTDLVEVFEAVAHKRLNDVRVEIIPETCATVMLVSGGYPGEYQKGKEISHFEKTSDCLVFHAGTRRENQKVFTHGGRVLAISGLGKNLDEALQKAYDNANIIDFEGKYFRRDIGLDLKAYI